MADLIGGKAQPQVAANPGECIIEAVGGPAAGIPLSSPPNTYNKGIVRLEPPPVPANPKLMFSTLVAGGRIAASVAAKQQAKLAERGSVLAAGVAEPLFAVTAKDALVPLGADGLPAAAGRVLLSRTDAEQRLAALPADGRRFQIVPEVQGVV